MRVLRAVGSFVVASAISWGCFDTHVVYSETDDDENEGGAPEPGAGGRTGGADAECMQCANEACEDEFAVCRRTARCEEVATCMLACEAAEAFCTSECVRIDVASAPDATLLSACAYRLCQACTASFVGEGGSSGVLGSAGREAQGGRDTSMGGASAGGRSGGASKGGATTGGATAGGRSGAPAGGDAGHAGTSGALSGINWIALDANWADEAVPPNDALGISGTFYVYSDGCATLNWDLENRCVSGTLCPIDPPLYSNWGVAVGFDFRNTGMNGTPPNTKLLWDAEGVGAKGVAWEISGSAPGFQVWVLNMDPAWKGECGGDRCEIDGAPDGASSPALDGQLLFDNLQKDNWGGSGTSYVFDRAAIHALQFKLAGLVAGGMSFDFCIDRLGIIL